MEYAVILRFGNPFSFTWMVLRLIRVVGTIDKNHTLPNFGQSKGTRILLETLRLQ